MDAVRTAFGAKSTADEVLAGVELTGKRAIVTGGASGIGIETARALAKAGADVTLAVRNMSQGAHIASEIIHATGNAHVQVRPLDLSRIQTVRDFTASWNGPLHILINNAGVMATPTLERTDEGWESQLATNFIGHFALAMGLLPALARAGGARVVSVSSSGHLLAPVMFDDPHFRFVRYDPLLAYGQSKTACALLAVAATSRWMSAYGIATNALNPGAIATNLQKHTGGLRTPEERRKTPAQGAATSVLLAASPLVAGISGRYFEDCNEAMHVTVRPDDYVGVAPYALDPANAERLWEVATRWVT